MNDTQAPEPRAARRGDSQEMSPPDRLITDSPLARQAARSDGVRLGSQRAPDGFMEGDQASLPGSVAMPWLIAAAALMGLTLLARLAYADR